MLVCDVTVTHLQYFCSSTSSCSDEIYYIFPRDETRNLEFDSTASTQSSHYHLGCFRTSPYSSRNHVVVPKDSGHLRQIGILNPISRGRCYRLCPVRGNTVVSVPRELIDSLRGNTVSVRFQELPSLSTDKNLTLQRFARVGRDKVVQLRTIENIEVVVTAVATAGHELRVCHDSTRCLDAR